MPADPLPAGNAPHVTGLRDLGRPDIALVMPNPQWLRDDTIYAASQRCLTVTR